jgi:hypothetical protein
MSKVKNVKMFSEMTDKELIKQIQYELELLKSNPTFDTIYDICDNTQNEYTIEQRNNQIATLAKVWLVNNK